MVVRVNGNSEHYNGHVSNKSLPWPLSRAMYASTGGIALALLYTTHFWQSFELPIFIHEVERKRERKRSLCDGKFVNSRRALAPL